ncbi:MAG: hypothetical protein AAF922_09885 [Pseudomonadota bacterium]
MSDTSTNPFISRVKSNFDEGEIERALSNRVSRRERALTPRVPDRKGKHLLKSVEKAFAHFLIKVEKNLDVGIGREPVPAACQLCAQNGMLVNFAVADEVNGSVFVGYWLMVTRRVDDGKTRVADPAIIEALKIIAVGTTVLKAVQYSFDCLL